METKTNISTFSKLKEFYDRRENPTDEDFTPFHLLNADYI